MASSLAPAHLGDQHEARNWLHDSVGKNLYLFDILFCFIFYALRRWVELPSWKILLKQVLFFI